MKNKSLIFVLIFLITIFSFVGDSFCANIITWTDNNGDERQCPPLPKENELTTDKFIYKRTINAYFFLEDGAYFYIKGGNRIGVYGGYRICSPKDDGSWEIGGIQTISQAIDKYIGIVSEFSYFATPIYADIDQNSVYLESKENFFYPTPLARVMTVEKENKKVATTLVGLVGLLIPFLICLLGFWKAWHLLLRILYAA